MTVSVTQVRAGCPARQHDTAVSAKKHGCRCPAARRAERDRKRRHEQTRNTRDRASGMHGWPTGGLPPFRTHPAAACTRLKNPDIMYGGRDRGWGDETGMSYNQALAVCARCPLTAACLEWAIQHGEIWGVWGGVRPVEIRRRIAERRNQQAVAA